MSERVVTAGGDLDVQVPPSSLVLLWLLLCLRLKLYQLGAAIVCFPDFLRPQLVSNCAGCHGRCLAGDNDHRRGWNIHGAYHYHGEVTDVGIIAYPVL